MWRICYKSCFKQRGKAKKKQRNHFKCICAARVVLQNAICEIFFTHIPQYSFVACWTVQFDSKFREFSYEIPRMDVSYRRMIFSLSCCPSRMRSTAFETCSSRTFMKSWQSIPGPKKQRLPGAIRYAENGLQFCQWEGNISKGRGKRDACEPLRYLFYIGRWWSSFPWGKHRDRKPKMNTTTCDTFVPDI